MAAPRRSAVPVAATLAVVFVLLLPSADVSAGPVAAKAKPDAAGESIRAGAALAPAAQRRLSRNRRNISWYKQHSDFWSWYKYFTDNGNQEAVQELDRIYLTYLQNKNRAEGRRSYKAYLRHLGEIYKSCADSDDPNCVASYTARPETRPPEPAPVKACDPAKDAYCLYATLVAGKSPYLPLPAAAAAAPAPVKSPAPLFVRSAASAKAPQSGYYYYAPPAGSFLSKEQKSELLRVCGAEDVECLQYHLRAAYGYPPAAAGAPPTHLVQKAPTGLYLQQYPDCDPLRDPYCAHADSRLAPKPPPPSCNPLFDEGCNPLTASKYATPPQVYTQEAGEETAAAAIRAPPPAADYYSDPYGMFQDSNVNANRVADPYAAYRHANAMPANDPYTILRRFLAQAQSGEPESNPNDPFATMRRRSARPHYPLAPPTYEEPSREERHPLGPPGKTKEGYDCFIGYDRECFPLRSGARRGRPTYEPHPNTDGARDGVLEPADPHCDPELDHDCRLRRVEPQTEAPEADPYEAENYQSGQEESHVSNPPAPPPDNQGMASLQDILRSYGDHFLEHDDYRKK
ncbi:actinodin1 [Festucalex cinctus]